MTDGWSNYPRNGVSSLQKLQKLYPNKLNYAGIEFQSKNNVMKLISEELQGKTGTAYN